MRPIEVLARGYLDAQQTRIGLEGRIRKLLESWLPHRTETIEETGRKPHTKHHILCPTCESDLEIDIEQENMTCKKNPEHKFQISNLLDSLNLNVQDKEIYRTLLTYRSRLKNEELAMLQDAKNIIQGNDIFDYCESVKGLGTVAALTFLGYIDPAKCCRPDSKVVSAGHMFAYLGLVPGAKLRAGKQGGFNPVLKGRFWVIGRNVIMAKDPYYTQLYKLKKEYYANRPDIAAKKDTERGWKGHVDNMAKRYMLKLIISHALEVISLSEGYDISNLHSHRGYIPPPPYKGIRVPEENKKTKKRKKVA